MLREKYLGSSSVTQLNEHKKVGTLQRTKESTRASYDIIEEIQYNLLGHIGSGSQGLLARSRFTSFPGWNGALYDG